MIFAEFVEDLAAAERADLLAELEANAPEPTPPMVIETVDQAQDLAHAMFPGPGEAVRWLVDTVIEVFEASGHLAPRFAARSARRWLQPGACPASRGAVLITVVEAEANRRIDDANAAAEEEHDERVQAVNDAPDTTLAAARLRRLNPQGVSVGSVAVAYDGVEDGNDRGIGTAHIDWTATVAALENGDLDVARDAFSEAVLDDYDPDLGLTLSVINYEYIDLI